MKPTRESAGAISFNTPSHLPTIAGSKNTKPVMLPPGRAKLSTYPAATGSETPTKTMGIARVSRDSAASCPAKQANSTFRRRKHELGRVGASALVIAPDPACVDADVAALAQRGDDLAPERILRVEGHQHADAPRLFRLLRARRERPCRRGGESQHERAASYSVHSRTSGNPGDTVRGSGSPLPRGRTDLSLAAHHPITSSAAVSNVGGTSRPSVLAVLRLITSSYLVGACTGRCEGFSPLRMRST